MCYPSRLLYAWERAGRTEIRTHFRPCWRLGTGRTHMKNMGISDDKPIHTGLRPRPRILVTLLACGVSPTSIHCSYQDPLEPLFRHTIAVSLACEELGCTQSWLHSWWAEYTLASHCICQVQSLGLFTYKMWVIIPALLLRQDADGQMQQEVLPAFCKL